MMRNDDPNFDPWKAFERRRESQEFFSGQGIDPARRLLLTLGAAAFAIVIVFAIIWLARHVA